MKKLFCLQDIEFIAGVKKHNQFSIKGIEETCVIQTVQVALLISSYLHIIVCLSANFVPDFFLHLDPIY